MALESSTECKEGCDHSKFSLRMQMMILSPMFLILYTEQEGILLEPGSGIDVCLMVELFS